MDKGGTSKQYFRCNISKPMKIKKEFRENIHWALFPNTLEGNRLIK